MIHTVKFYKNKDVEYNHPIKYIFTVTGECIDTMNHPTYEP